ncbi:MAG: hypothetical protein JNK82_40280 [Myxococcaceae bacterium]|nr:hypothetical protein [Myxococcaceae bacterium]
MLRAALLLSLTACFARGSGAGGSANLDGVTFALKSSPGLRLSVDGSLPGAAAEIVFDVATPLSRVTTGCFDDVPTTGGTVRIPRPDGETDTANEVAVQGLVIGSHRYASFVAGARQGDRCVVTIGNDQLLPWALSVDVARRTVTFSKSQSVEHWRGLAVKPPAERAGYESHLLELTRDPRTDWPLLPVKVTQGPAALVGPFVLSTGEPVSQVADDAARGAGLRTGFELLEGIELPEGLQVPPELESFKGIKFDSFELAPGVGVREGALKALPGTEGRPRAAAGVLGCDLWGRFDAVIDVGANVLLLQRPRVLASGAHQRCDRGGRVDEESCFELQVAKTKAALVATGTIWRALPEGGQLHFDFSSAKGKISSPCRMGLTFSPTDRGESTQHELPWEQLASVMPACASALKDASVVELAMFEDGALPECPGTCAFAQDLRTGRVSCECQPQVAGIATDAERHFLRIYKQLLENRGNGLPPELEPEDPP